MTLSAVPDLHQLSQTLAARGVTAGTKVGTRADVATWPLAAGRANSVRMRHASELVVSSGRVWATFDGPHGAAACDQGDLVLEAGARLHLAAGQRVVVEALRSPDGAQACVAVQRQTRRYAVPVLLRELVREALAVLRGATLGAVRGALRGALAGARAARAASSASRAQGAMACGGLNAAP